MNHAQHALYLIILAFAIVACTATGEVVTPKTPTQAVYAAEVSLTTATNALADAHDRGQLVGPRYEEAKALQARASAALKDARAAAMAKDATKAEVSLKTLTSLIDQIAIYNGGKK
jgi:hypothetical protein